MNPKERLISQFKKPSGVSGLLAGKLMYYRRSNRERNRWMISLLDLKPGMRVLELGCGPGYALNLMLKLDLGLKIYGIDHSDSMIQQTKKNTKNDKTITLHHGDISSVKTLNVQFDRICCSNVHQFWNDESSVLKNLFNLLLPDGRLVITYLPRCKDPTNDLADEEAKRLHLLFHETGFKLVAIKNYPMRPIKVISVIGEKK